jgi:hypothetical protein
MGRYEVILSSLLILGLLFQPVCRAEGEERINLMSSDAIQTLRSSNDPKELMMATLELARSKADRDHHVLREALHSEIFLGKLDSEEEYEYFVAKRLRVGRILTALSKNEAPGARETIKSLTQNPMFLEEPARVEYLLEATVPFRLPSPDIVRFWQEQSATEEGYATSVVEAVVKNGSPEALRVFEKIMADPVHDEEDKIAWMRSDVLEHRDDLPLLQSCERMLTGDLPEELRQRLIEVLFDYRPGEWFRPAFSYAPPDRDQASPEVKAQLVKLGEIALKLPLRKELRHAVQKELKNLRE